MRPAVVRRTCGVNDRQLAFIVNRFERHERRVQSEITVEIDGALLARRRLFYGNGRPERVISLVLERNDDVESIHAAALEDHHQRLSACILFGARGANQKARWQTQSQEAEARGFKKRTARGIHDYLR